LPFYIGSINNKGKSFGALFRDRLGKVRGAVLWTIFVILVVLWVLGYSFQVAGSLIHIVLAAAVVVLLISLLKKRRRL
jgi:carbon starvation protein CstA